MRYHVVMSTSHWQGARRYPVALAPCREVAEHVADLLTTCSFCAPGRIGSYRVGECYTPAIMRICPSVPTLPDDAAEWERVDVDAWLQQEAAER